jgi:acrylyl-CoA reductase (NADPH)
LITEHEGTVATGVTTLAKPEGDVIIKVAYSGINFKDAMAIGAKSAVRRKNPLVGGVDAAGTVVVSSDPSLAVGTEVVVHGGGQGTSEDGGFAQYLAAPAERVLPLPEGMTSRSAMILGTAGYTAAASVDALEHHGLTPADGEVVVTGATGGVGSIAVQLLARCGYRVVASTGSPHEAAWLLERGAHRLIGRDELRDRPDRVLATPTWAGAVDCVGGQALADILAALRWGGAVAASGLVASAQLTTTVYPFITRNVALLGIDSVEPTLAAKARIWAKLAQWFTAESLEPFIDAEIGLDDVATHLERVAKGSSRGRVLVNLGN